MNYNTIKVIFASIPLIYGISSTSYAQVTPQKSYNTLSIDSSKALFPPVNEKPVVIEFFWYGCTHCYHMEPLVQKMVKDRKGDFTFKRYPVVFPKWESGAQLYFTLDSLGLSDKMHEQVFETIQKKKLNIMDDKKLRDQFLKENNVDLDKFYSIYDSFSMNSKLNQARTNAVNYKIQSSPTFFINNKYEVNPSITGSYDKTISSINQLLDKEKKNK